jgi:hypothetical protein
MEVSRKEGAAAAVMPHLVTFQAQRSTQRTVYEVMLYQICAPVQEAMDAEKKNLGDARLTQKHMLETDLAKETDEGKMHYASMCHHGRPSLLRSTRTTRAWQWRL